MKLYLQIIILSALSLPLARAVSAQSNITQSDKTPSSQVLKVAPAIIPITIQPGKTYSFDIEISNLTDNALPIYAAVEPLYEEDDGMDSTEIPMPTLISWVKLHREDFLLDARSQDTLKISVSVPKQVPVGGYYGMITLRPLVAQGTDQDKPRIIPHLGVILLGSIGVPPDSASQLATITKFVFDSMIYEKGPARLDLKVKNIALYHFSAKPILELRPLSESTTISKTILTEKIILPGRIRQFSETVQLPPRPVGIYKATLVVAVGHGAQIQTNRLLIVFPWKKAIMITSILIILYITIKYRIRIFQALKVLIRG